MNQTVIGRLYGIVIMLILLAMSFDLMYPNVILVGVLFAVRVLLIVDNLNRNDVKDILITDFKTIGLLLNLFVLMLILFGFIEFWYIYVISQSTVLLFGAVWYLENKPEIQTLYQLAIWKRNRGR